ncbi:MAG: hypothetical protein HGA85_05785, partial [Nanoarchaeota archaeon]|nr:hypothetical protein [Nanoarchaeota archaeon]
RERIVAIVSMVFCILFIVGVFIPGLIDMDMFKYGFGIAFISGFLAIMAFITFLLYNARANVLDRIFSGEKIVHWHYEGSEWQRHAMLEFETQKEEKWGIFFLILPIAFIVVAVFAIGTGAWAYSLIFFTSLMSLLAVVAFIGPRIKYTNDKKTEPEAWISKDGIYLTGEFHNWGMFSSSLDRVLYDERADLIVIEYSYLTNTGRNSYVVRVPVPKGKEKEAELAVKKMLK